MTDYRNLEGEAREVARQLLDQTCIKGVLAAAGFEVAAVHGSFVILSAGECEVRLSVGLVGDRYCPVESWINATKLQLSRMRKRARGGRV